MSVFVCNLSVSPWWQRKEDCFRSLAKQILGARLFSYAVLVENCSPSTANDAKCVLWNLISEICMSSLYQHMKLKKKRKQYDCLRVDTNERTPVWKPYNTIHQGNYYSHLWHLKKKLVLLKVLIRAREVSRDRMAVVVGSVMHWTFPLETKVCF